MDYEKKYKKALEMAKSWYIDAQIDFKKSLETLFPELKESEDERVRKELLNAFQESEDSLYMVLTPHRRESFIAWLEKQGKQKYADKVEPSVFKDKLLELFQRFRWYCKDKTQTNGDILEYVDAHIQELIDTIQNHSWSEEDYLQLDAAINIVANSGHTCTSDWLKSLRPQSQWKPSEEQIRRLEYFLKLWGKTEDIENTKVFETVKIIVKRFKETKRIKL